MTATTTEKPAPPPPPPLLVPEARWRLSPYLANLEPGGRCALSVDEVRALTPYRWAGAPASRLREAGYDYKTVWPRLYGDSLVWARAAEPDEARLGEAVRSAVRAARALGVGVLSFTSWHLPPQYTGSGILRRWRPARDDDAPEVQRQTLRGARIAPGEELELQCGTSPTRVAELVREWVKGWAPG